MYRRLGLVAVVLLSAAVMEPLSSFAAMVTSPAAPTQKGPKRQRYEDVRAGAVALFEMLNSEASVQTQAPAMYLGNPLAEYFDGMSAAGVAAKDMTNAQRGALVALFKDATSDLGFAAKLPDFLASLDEVVFAWVGNLEDREARFSFVC